jgi:hypothetical protein
MRFVAVGLSHFRLSVFSDFFSDPLLVFHSPSLSKERVRERSPLRDCIEDRFQYAVHVSEHFVVPESQNLVAAILDQLRAAIIVLDYPLLRMLFAIEFDY